MPDDPRVEQLLDELLDSHAEPEEVCGSFPELLPVVRNRWRQMRRLRADLNALFPRSDDWTPHDATGVSFPHIPGYEVDSVLGRGGMGIVFRARQLKLNRFVALKISLADAYTNRRDRERFQREAEVVAKLHHPNIVQIYDVGEIDGRPYFTMEVMEGGSLAKHTGTPHPAQKAAEFVASLAGAVHAAHSFGIVHRDLKPSNILLSTDETLKISDFGLARSLEGGAGLTQSGVPVGTPSYMAPEQARGQTHVGPAADVYALGAILYECLTGRPPFRAATAAETIQQVISQEPAPPSRLNDKVPRDLDTICLRCLSKEPDRRYASAAALAEDLRRFGDGRPIRARPVGWAERSWRWGRRNPTAAGLLATALALIGLVFGGGTWFVQQRAERRADAGHLRNQVSTDVDQAERLRNGFHFHEARELLDLARQRLEPAGPDDLRQQVNKARADLDLVDGLDVARLQLATLVEGKFDFFGAEPLYEEAFAKAGLGKPEDGVDAFVARVRGSGVSAEIVGALDNWATITRFVSRREWLLDVARRLDPDPSRDRLRHPDLWQDGPGLAKLVRDTPVDQLSPQLASALGRIIFVHRGEAVPLLTAAQARCPQDFWLNFELGMALRRAQRWDEALSYYRAALALRPEVAVVHNDLGQVQTKRGRRDEAIGYFREAVRLNPKYSLAYSNLGAALHDQGKLDDAVGYLQEAIRLDPKSAIPLNNLGAVLRDQGKLDEAMGHFQEAICLDPRLAAPHNGLGDVLRRKGRLDDAIGHFEDAVRLDPKWGVAHINLGAALNLKGRMDDAIGQYQEAIRVDPRVSVLAHSNLGIALQAKGRLDDALGHFQDAVRLDPNLADSHNNLGKALLRKGRLDEAIDHLREAVRLNPNSAAARTNLGAALIQKGRRDEAISQYEQAIRLDPNSAVAHSNLGVAFRQKGRRNEAISHFEQAIQLDPKLAPAHAGLGAARLEQGKLDEAVGHLQDAIRLDPSPAAPHSDLGGALLDQGKLEEAIGPLQEAIRLDPKFVPAHYNLGLVLRDKGRLVEAIDHLQEVVSLDPNLVVAQRWLFTCRYEAARAAVSQNAETEKLSEQERADRRGQAHSWLRANLDVASRLQKQGAAVPWSLKDWQTESALTSVRDPAELAKLPAAEREDWQKLWADVAALIAASR